jgi:ABC-type glutathione transport system ATPase component
MPQPLIDILHLKKYYPRHNGVFAKSKEPVRAVDGADLQIFPGETVALLGASGSGKTTLAHCLFRLAEPTAGNVFFRGRDVWAMNREELKTFRRQAQFIFQDADAALNPRLTAGNAVAEPLIAHRQFERKPARQRALDLLHQVGLSEQHFHALPGELSCGQRHRVVIARALALQPKFIAADEPFAALDVLTKSRLLELFISLQHQFGLTCFIISHDLSLVKRWCNRIAVMQQGKIVEIKAKAYHQVVAGAADAWPGT